MGSKSSAPAAPNPYQTAQAQTASNVQTATAQGGLNNVNLYTPLGSSTYSLTGNPAGGAAPVYNQNIALSPQGQQIYGNYLAEQQALGGIGRQLLPQVQQALGTAQPTPANLNDAAQQAQDAYYQHQTQYLDPQWQVAEEQLNSQLANQGISAQSDPEAWNTAMTQFNNAKQQAYSNAQQNAILAGPQQAQALQSLYATGQMIPFNELQALMGQSQVQMPQGYQPSPTNVAPTNLAGNVYQSYQGNLGAYNAQLASQNAFTGGLMGLAGTLGAAALL